VINNFKIINSNRVITFFLIILFLISLNYYLLFIIASLFFISFIIYFDLLKNLTKLNLNLFKLFPLLFYAQKLISIFINQNKSIFWDMQLFIFELNCQFDWSLHYTYKFSNEIIECTSLGFGPFPKYIYGPFSKLFLVLLDPWSTSLIIFSVLFIIFIYLILSKVSHDQLFIYLLITFPPFLFLFETLNHDLIFLYSFLLLIRNNKILNNNLYLFLLTILTLFKIYTIAILFGELIYRFFNNQRFSKILIVSLFNVVILFWYYTSLNLEVPNPISKVLTFGLLHDLRLIKSININSYFLFIILLFTGIILLISKRKNVYRLLFKSKIETWNKNILYLIVLFLFLGLFINSYSNYGYKFSLNILIVLVITRYLTKNALILLVFVFSMIPIQYFVGSTLENNFFELVIFFLNKVAYYGYLFFILTLAIYVIENKNLITKDISDPAS